jgi:hypothetical protein
MNTGYIFITFSFSGCLHGLLLAPSRKGSGCCMACGSAAVSLQKRSFQHCASSIFKHAPRQQRTPSEKEAGGAESKKEGIIIRSVALSPPSQKEGSISPFPPHTPTSTGKGGGHIYKDAPPAAFRPPPLVPFLGYCCWALVPVRHGLINFLAPYSPVFFFGTRGWGMSVAGT